MCSTHTSLNSKKPCAMSTGRCIFVALPVPTDSIVISSTGKWAHKSEHASHLCFSQSSLQTESTQDYRKILKSPVTGWEIQDGSSIHLLVVHGTKNSRVGRKQRHVQTIHRKTILGTVKFSHRPSISLFKSFLRGATCIHNFLKRGRALEGALMLPCPIDPGNTNPLLRGRPEPRLHPLPSPSKIHQLPEQLLNQKDIL